MLQYDFEEKINISINSNFEWVYSDEHFNEINRKEDSRFFEVLEKIKARKIKIKLNDKFEITNEAIIHDYQNPKMSYDEYFDTIDQYKETSLLFYPLQSLFYGNVNAIEPAQYIEDFKKQLFLITKEIFHGIEDKGIQIENEKYINSVAKELENALISAKSQVKPLHKMRKMIANKQFSNLNEKDGIIIDQIWNVIGQKMQLITKDQFFGKEKLPFYQPKTINRSQPIFLGVAQCHAALNFLGYWPDEGLPRISKIYGINSDASHVAHSYFCYGIISADYRLCMKARAIYEYFGKDKNVFHVQFC